MRSLKEEEVLEMTVANVVSSSTNSIVLVVEEGKAPIRRSKKLVLASSSTIKAGSSVVGEVIIT